MVKFLTLQLCHLFQIKVYSNLQILTLVQTMYNFGGTLILVLEKVTDISEEWQSHPAGPHTTAA